MRMQEMVVGAYFRVPRIWGGGLGKILSIDNTSGTCQVRWICEIDIVETFEIQTILDVGAYFRKE